ncbi:MAG: type II toxin-antitoxin system Phd/YefM family antitoxin [Myxococcales bacterium]|nr:type II toxin-antitoxin system Phd/YefM family antitoxin [Myxococcales bacterium]
MKARSRERSIPAGEFKAKCLALFDDVETRGDSFVVTKRGRPVARIVPVDRGRASSLVGSLLAEEDVLTPVAVAWEASS